VALGTNAGDVYLEGHYRNAASFGREMSRQVQTPAMRAGQEASKHFGRKFAAGLAIGGAVIGAGLYKATKLAMRGIAATTKAASDLNETVNKTKVIFGGSAKGILDWSRSSAKALGLSRQEALASAAGFGDMFKQIGFGLPMTSKMSKGMVTLSADLASFHNADITQVLEAQSAAFRGEYDSLQRFIPTINAASVQQLAMSQTGKSNAKELTAQDKALATYTIMLKETKDAQGDFTRTSKDNANQQRIAKAQWMDLKAALGQAFLPAQLAVTKAFTEKLLPAGKVFVKELAPGIKTTAMAIATSLSGAVPPAAELAETARHLGTRLSELGPGLGAKVGAGLGKLFDLLQRLGPELRNANVESRDLGPTLRLSGAMFGFVADNADTLAKHLPLVVGAFVAYKAAQAAANTAALLSVPIRAAEVVATIALARSNRALIASMGQRTAATVALTTAESGLVVSTTAAGGAAAASTGKFGGLAAKLGLFAAAAGAGAYQGNQLAKAAKDGTVVSGPFADVRARILRGLGLEATTTKELSTAQADLAAKSRLATTASDLHAAAVRGERSAINQLRTALEGEEHAELDVRQAKINVSSAQARLTELVKGGRRGSVEYKQAQIDLRRAQLDLKVRTDAYKTAQLKANSATGGAMRASQQARPQVQRLGSAAQTGGRRAGDARIPWRRLGEDVSRTYREIHNKTAHITAKFGWQGLKVFNIGAGGLKALADGGPTSVGRVTLVGEEGPELVRFTSPGHVYPADETQQILRRGMADGGPVGRIPRFGMQGQAGMVKALGDWDVQVGKVMTLAAQRFKQRMEAAGGALGGGSGPGGWRWQMAVLRSAFPGLPLISGYRPGAITATGNRSYHAMGRAVDVPPRMDVFNWIRGMFGKRTRELIFSPANNRQVWNGRPHMYSGITRANHWDHVHWAYDKGGWLMPGQSGTNYTNKPERVLGPDERVPTADEIARALLRALRQDGAIQPVVYLDRQKVSRGVATGLLWEARR
jgi:hypothetical protein